MRVSDIVSPSAKGRPYLYIENSRREHHRIDLNVDIGEGFPYDKDLLKFASSANVCCGEHAGSRDLTQETVALCKARKIRVGAHPGYPDRPSMGREHLEGSHIREYLDSILDQVKWFVTNGAPTYLKPHGAFYSDTGPILPEDWESALAMIPGSTAYEAAGVYLAQYPGIQVLTLLLRIYKLPLMGLEPTAHRIVAQRANQSLLREGFADRAYRPDGALVARTEPGAVLKDPQEIRQQVLRLAPEVDSICLHGDTPNCVEFAELVYSTLTDAGYEVGS